MFASKRRLQYCEEHHFLALDLYHKYKEATKKSITHFKDNDLILAIKLRSQYDKEFVGGDDGAHFYYIELLKELLNYPINKRKKIYHILIKKFDKLWLS